MCRLVPLLVPLSRCLCLSLSLCSPPLPLPLSCSLCCSLRRVASTCILYCTVHVRPNTAILYSNAVCSRAGGSQPVIVQSPNAPVVIQQSNGGAASGRAADGGVVSVARAGLGAAASGSANGAKQQPRRHRSKAHPRPVLQADMEPLDADEQLALESVDAPSDGMPILTATSPTAPRAASSDAFAIRSGFL